MEVKPELGAPEGEPAKASKTVGLGLGIGQGSKIWGRRANRNKRWSIGNPLYCYPKII